MGVNILMFAFRDKGHLLISGYFFIGISTSENMTTCYYRKCSFLMFGLLLVLQGKSYFSLFAVCVLNCEDKCI